MRKSYTYWPLFESSAKLLRLETTKLDRIQTDSSICALCRASLRGRQRRFCSRRSRTEIPTIIIKAICDRHQRKSSLLSTLDPSRIARRDRGRSDSVRLIVFELPCGGSSSGPATATARCAAGRRFESAWSPGVRRHPGTPGKTSAIWHRPPRVAPYTICPSIVVSGVRRP